MVELKVFDTLESWLEEFESIGLQDKIKEYIQVPEMVIEILDQVVDVLGDEVIDIKEFTKILVSGSKKKKLGSFQWL